MSETTTAIETRSTRVNVMLDHGTLAFMDGETARLKEQLGAHVGRSEMIRAVFGAIADASLTLGNCRSEEDARAAFRRHFRRVADSVRAESDRR